MLKVYIASPYEKGDMAINVRRQLEVSDKLIDMGYAPYAPLYFHFQHIFNPRSDHEWLSLCLVWIESCNVVLRLPGESAGADMETRYATDLGIPVFHSFQEIRDWEISHKKE